MTARRASPAGRPDRPPLRGLELEVMHVVWQLGECTSGDVIEAFRGKRTLAASTLRNVLAKLRAKGYVQPVPSIGRGFLLRPAVPREDAARRTIRSLLHAWFSGSPQQAIAYMLDDATISDDELAGIKKLIDDKRRQGSQR